MIRLIPLWFVITFCVCVVAADRSADVSAAASAEADAFALQLAQTPVRPADLVLRNGKIVTVDEAKPEAQAMAIGGDTILAVGSNQEIQPYIGASTKVIDLKGALATPGFIDAHVHFTGVGDAAKNLKLSTAASWNDIVASGPPSDTARIDFIISLLSPETTRSNWRSL